jgi:hypothetical protein
MTSRRMSVAVIRMTVVVVMTVMAVTMMIVGDGFRELGQSSQRSGHLDRPAQQCHASQHGDKHELAGVITDGQAQQ